MINDKGDGLMALIANLAGTTVTVNDVLVKYGWNGDVNLDGRVNADDYFRIDSGFLNRPPSPTYRDGDFNFDGKINADDYFLIDQAFLNQKGVVLSAPKPALASSTMQASDPVFSRKSIHRGTRTPRAKITNNLKPANILRVFFARIAASRLSWHGPTDNSPSPVLNSGDESPGFFEAEGA
jgi:hypothetical protein